MKQITSNPTFIRIPVLVVFVLFFTQVNVASGQLVKKDATAKKVKLAAVPMLNYNRSFGFMYGAMAQGFYKINRNDTISPSSSTMVMGMYSTSKTYMMVGVQNLYLNEDRWRVKVVGGYGDMFFQYFQQLPDLPPPMGQVWVDGVWIDYENKIGFAVLDVKRRILPKLYLGPLFTASWATTIFDLENPITGELPTKEANMMSLGYSVQYDSRDNVNYPTTGYFIDFKNRFNNESFGATANFAQFELSANYFWDVFDDERSVLVSRVHVDAATGDVPFQGQGYLGRDDLRGYSQGEFRGNQVYDVQVEWRQQVAGRLGMVGFFGVGKVMDDLKDFGSSDLLPGGGLGLRYRMIKSEKINIGLDAGVGRDDWSLTFRIGESFGR